MIWITPDLYGPGQRALRIALARFVDRLETASAEAESVPALACAWTTVIELVEAQGSSEAACLHPMLRLRAPAFAERLDRQHGRLERSAGAISRVLASLRDIETDAARQKAIRETCRLAATFLADCEQHQREERQGALPVLLDAFPPPALHAAARALAATAPSIEDGQDHQRADPSAGSNFFAHARRSLERAARGARPSVEHRAHVTRAPRRDRRPVTGVTDGRDGTK
ncbi:hypothetical protein GGR25_004024 [Kaistia hirudinis]|uniref:Hemerythrin-like domain-containing protein n=1 Tax=Kaistia hirudinis TaxID=1293440 RepID=A0A840ARG7_9HYPH|nr:hypothetical protein [Kaistia hirudinis]MBB3932960.1 hypothetical protein [Kaistia hirudinis]